MRLVARIRECNCDQCILGYEFSGRSENGKYRLRLQDDGGMGSWCSIFPSLVSHL